jgi:SAM-dependent methyltransferase
VPIINCRVCSCGFFKEPLLQYKNMPSVAQFLPDLESLEGDKGIDLEVCQCSGCGLVQLSNDPVPYFREVIRAAAFSEEMKGFRAVQFNKFINRFSLKGKKVIEIGCGRGEYLSLLHQCGTDSYGLEQSRESVENCVRNGLKVSKGFIEYSDFRIDHSPFDAFIILNFLEHMPNVNTVLRGISNNLTDNAVGLVEVPNFDMILKNNLFSEFTSDHLFYFTRDTLLTTLKLNGFEILECNEVWYDYIISAVVKKRVKLELKQFSNHQLKLKSEIEEYINQSENKKIAIWGAGHQALAIISLMDLSNRVKYVVDSAIFKQGKYTPATHIPIVSPETLESDPVDAVIIMAASYSDEVSRIIRQRFNKNLRVSILRDHGLEVI